MSSVGKQGWGCVWNPSESWRQHTNRLCKWEQLQVRLRSPEADTSPESPQCSCCVLYPAATPPTLTFSITCKQDCFQKGVTTRWGKSLGCTSFPYLTKGWVFSTPSLKSFSGALQPGSLCLPCLPFSSFKLVLEHHPEHKPTLTACAQKHFIVPCAELQG